MASNYTPSKPLYRFLTTLLIGLIISLFGFFFALKIQKHHEQQILDDYGSHFVTTAEVSFEQIVNELRFMAELFYASEVVTQPEFTRFAQNYFTHDGFTLIAWVSNNSKNTLATWRNTKAKRTIKKLDDLVNHLHLYRDDQLSTRENQIIASEILENESSITIPHRFIALMLPVTSSAHHTETQEGDIIILIDLVYFFKALIARSNNTHIASLQLLHKKNSPMVEIESTETSVALSTPNIKLHDKTWKLLIGQTNNASNDLSTLFPWAILCMELLITLAIGFVIYQQTKAFEYR